MTADASGLTTMAGLTEATMVGNVLVQAIAAGRFSSIAATRQHVSENINFEEFKPRRSAEIEEAAGRYFGIDSRFAPLRIAKVK